MTGPAFVGSVALRPTSGRPNAPPLSRFRAELARRGLDRALFDAVTR